MAGRPSGPAGAHRAVPRVGRAHAEEALELEGPVLVFVGPSGSGKSTVVRELHHHGVIAVSPSWTTRPRRDDERGETVEHRFVTEEEFTDREKAGCFLEVVRPFGLPYRYGLPRVEPASADRVRAIMVRAPHMPLVVQHFPRRVTYQIEDTYARASERMVAARGSVAALGSRLERFEDERRLGRTLASRTFVNDATVAELCEAVADAITTDFGQERSER